MKKVTLEITACGWTTTIQDGDKKIKEVHVKTPRGSEGIEGDFEAEPDEIISDELYDALNSCFPYNIMEVLDSYGS